MEQPIKKIDNLLAVLEVIADEASGDLSVNQLMILLRTERNDRVGTETLQTDLMRKLGLSQASANRNVLALTEWRNSKSPGYDLIRQTLDPVDRRRKPLILNRNGKAVVRDIERKMK